MEKVSVLLLCLLASIMGAKAQIGYQISLLNTATGEPRANETVTVSVSLSNNANEVFYSETKSATTNDFGVLSLSIGNADTFANVDFSKMPFYIEVKANGVSIGRSQMLSVPVAEYAKRTGTLTKELLLGTWVREYNFSTRENWQYRTEYQVIPYDYMSYVEYRSSLVFKDDGKAIAFTKRKEWTEGYKDDFGNSKDLSSEDETTSTYLYYIEGNLVYMIPENGDMDPVHNTTDTNYTYHTRYAFYSGPYTLRYYSPWEILVDSYAYTKIVSE